MASTKSKPEKRLGEFLKEQQEPFILEIYLLERGCSKKWRSKSKGNSERSTSSASISKKRKSLFPFSKVITALHKKLAFHTEKSSAIIKGSGDRIEHVNVQSCSVDHPVVETERFSTATSSTMFHSCSDIDEDETSLSSQKDKPLFSSDTYQASSVCNMRLQSQQTTNNRKHRHRCIQDRLIPQSQNNETRNHEEKEREKKIRNFGVLVPKKITEDSLLSAAIWNLILHPAKKESNSTMELRELLGPNVSHILKSKRVLHKTKQLMFDCVREITITLPRREDGRQHGNKHLMGPEEIGKILCERIQEWGQQSGDETNLNFLLTLDYLNSISEWSKFERQVKDISVEIADAILECMNNEIVSDMIEILISTITN